MWQWLRSIFAKAPAPQAPPAADDQPQTEPVDEPAANAQPPEPSPSTEAASSDAGPAKAASAPAKKAKKAKKPNKRRKKRGLMDATSGRPQPRTTRAEPAAAPQEEEPVSLLPSGPSALAPEPPPLVSTAATDGAEPTTEPEAPRGPVPAPAPAAPSEEAPAPPPPPPRRAAAPAEARDRGPSQEQRDRDAAAWIVVPKLEALLQEVDTALANSEAERGTLVALRKRFTREWRALRPIPGERREDLTAGHDARLAEIDKRIRALPDPREAEERQAIAKREVLIAQAAALADVPDLKAAIDKAKALQREFRDAPRVPREALGPLRDRFKAAVDAVFARREAERSERKDKLGALVHSAETLTSAADPVRAAEAMKQLQAQWKSIGGLRGEDGDALWTRFRAAADTIFERRRTLFQEREAEALRARQALIAEAQAMAADLVDDPDETTRKLMNRWKRLGRPPRDQADALWGAFRDALHRIRNPPTSDPESLGDGQDALRFTPFDGLSGIGSAASDDNR